MSVASLGRSAKALARRTLLAGLQGVTRRTPVLLPPEAGLVDLLDVRAPYRVAGDHVDYEIYAGVGGQLGVRLLEHVAFGPAPVLWQFDSSLIDSQARLRLQIRDGTMTHDGVVLGRVGLPALPPRFTSEFVFRGTNGTARRRRLGHYVVQPTGDEAYFTGAHYRDYQAQAAGDVAQTLAQLKEWRAASPVLEIGCATGLFLAACADAGIEAVGVDVSPWAVERARTRVAPRLVLQADVDRDDFPPEIARRRFQTVVMNAVLEHLQAPDALLTRLAMVVEPGGLLFLTTSNADSLTRWLFGADWEGLADPTHKSADRITPARLACWLEAAGWQVARMTTHSVWDDNPDPVHATLRDVAASDARFRQLLVQYQRGDFLDCVARRRAS